MAAQAFLLIASFLVVLFVLARPLGTGLARLINNVPLPGTGSVEKGIWRVLGVRDQEMNWRQYLTAILLLNIVGLIALFAMLMLQGILPFNPQQLPGLSWHLALNTAVSFVTNTNWQSYAGETTLSASHTQMSFPSISMLIRPRSPLNPALSISWLMFWVVTKEWATARWPWCCAAERVWKNPRLPA